MASIRVGDRQPGDVYAGRPGRGELGTFGNPYPVGEVCERCRKFHHSAASVMPCFRAYFEERARTDESFRAWVVALRDRVLWCPGRCKVRGGPCHADAIVEWLEKNSQS